MTTDALVQTSLIGFDNGARFSPCGRYRYTLWRLWGHGPRVNFLMLNPSTADCIDNDPTVERCERRAKAWGYDGLLVTNLFAYRSTDPSKLRAVEDPVGGVENNQAILETALRSALVVCAWGNDGALFGRNREVLEILKPVHERLAALRLTNEGHPYHPLYVPYSVEPVAFRGIPKVRSGDQ